MCWGAIRWARLRVTQHHHNAIADSSHALLVQKVHIGVDRFTAAEYGFDDKVFYDKVELEAGNYRCQPCDAYGDSFGIPRRATEWSEQVNSRQPPTYL